jgi:hypothetical protein
VGLGPGVDRYPGSDAGGADHEILAGPLKEAVTRVTRASGGTRIPRGASLTARC